MALRRARVIGLAVLAVQFVGLCVWSVIQIQHFALTLDFGTFSRQRP